MAGRGPHSGARTHRRGSLLAAFVAGAVLGVFVTSAGVGGGTAAAAAPCRTPVAFESSPLAAGSAAPAQSQYYVLTRAAGLKPADLNIYLRSWRLHSPQTRVVIFGDLSGLEPYYDSDPGVEVLPEPKTSANAGDNPNVKRFEYYGNYIKERIIDQGISGAGVVLMDSRDSFIQLDPWRDGLVQRLVAEDAVLFSLEGGLGLGNVSIDSRPVGDHPHNKVWVEACFGEKIVQEIGKDPISCAGVVLGGASGVLKYIQQMMDLLSAAGDECRRHGSDQGIHNYMLHYMAPRGQLPFKAVMRDNWHSPVHTTGYGWPSVIDRVGLYKRVNSSYVPSIIHQYDREEPILRLQRALYPVFPAEFVFRDRPSYKPGSFAVPV